MVAVAFLGRMLEVLLIKFDEEVAVKVVEVL